MKDPGQCVKDLLVAANVGVFGASSGWSINVGRLPSVPDTVIVCTATGGRNPLPHLLVNYPSVQVMVRGDKNGYAAAYDKLEAIVKTLLGIYTTVVQGDTYSACTQIGDVTYLGQDDGTRPLFSANFSFIVLPAAQSGDHRLPIT